MGSPTLEKACKHMLDEIRTFQNEDDKEPC